MGLPAVVVACIVLVVGSGACPHDCSCRWKGGKETVDCARKGLDAIPAGIASGTQVLDVSGNPFLTIQSQAFLQAGLLNLQRIYLSRCNLKQISESAFSRLTNLIDLDLGYNSLVSVPSKSFKECPALRRLVLSGNPILKLEANAFAHLPFLTMLELSRCQVHIVAPRAFDGLTALTHLKLDGNQLTTLKGGVVVGLVSLHDAALDGNPWRCDCALREMRAWLVKGRVPCPIPPVCEQPPRLRGIALDRVDAADLACEPQGESDKTAEVFAGDDVALTCRTKAVPEPRVQWHKSGRLLANWTSLSSRRLTIFENGTTEKITTLLIPSAQEADFGEYTCTADNRAGQWHATTTLHVLRPSSSSATLSGTHIVALIGATLLVICILVLVAILVRRRQICFSTLASSKNVTGVNHVGFSPDNNVGQSKLIRRPLLSNCRQTSDGRSYGKSFLENNFISRPDVVNVQTENESLTLAAVDANNKWPPPLVTVNGANDDATKRPTRYALLRTCQSPDQSFCDQLESPFVSDREA